MTHNKKLKDIKKLVKEENGEEAQLEMIMKALKPIGELTQKHLKKLRRQFKKELPESAFEVLNEDNPDQLVLRFNSIHESIFAKIYLEKIDARTHFVKDK